MKEIIEKYLTQRNRNIISIIVIVLGLSFIINYCFFEPTYINSYIASNIYLEPANSAFDDENFYNCVVDAYNSTNNKSVAYTTNLSDEELKTIAKLTCSNKGIVSASGVEKLIELKYLDLKNNELVDINITQNLELIELVLGADNFDSGGPYDPDGNKLTELDVSNNTKLKKIAVSNNKLTNLNVNNNKELVELSLYNNQLINLDLTNNNKLKILNVGFSYGCHNGNGLACGRNYGNFLSVLNLDSNVELEILYASNNQLEFIDLSNNKKLKKVQLSNNKLTSLDVRENIELLELSVDKNLFSSFPLLNENNKINIMIANNNQLSELDLNGLINLKYLNLSNNQLTKLNMINMNLIELDVYNNQLIELNVSGVASLENLYIKNNKLVFLDVSKNTKLLKLFADENQLSELDVSNNIALTGLYVSNNQLTELDVSNNTALISLSVDYNQLTSLDVSGASALKTLSVDENQLTSLDVSGAIALTYLDASDNQLTELDLTKNTKLVTLFVRCNQLVGLDVSQNLSLTSLDIVVNPFGKIYYVYKDSGDLFIENVVKIPNHLDWNKLSLSSGDINVATIDENNLVKLLKVGTVKIGGVVYKKNTYTRLYSVTNTINVVEITSNKYKIDEENSYIFVGSDSDVDTIKSNIKKSNEDIDVDIDMDKYKLYVKYEDEILKEFDIIGLSSNDYDLSKEYIYVGTSEVDLDKINNINCDKSIEDNKLVIKHGDNVLYEYKLIGIISEEYDLSKGYIYVGTGEVDQSKISAINGEIGFDNNSIIIKYNDEVVEFIRVLSISSNTYDLNKDYIYIGHEKLNLSKIDSINCEEFIEDDLLVIRYNNTVIDSYKLLRFSISDRNMYGDNIVVLEDISYDDFTSKINKSDEITYKIYNGEEEVTSGNILVDMEVRLYYNEKIIDTYMITNKDEYVEINNLDVDEDNKVINNIKLGSSIDSIISNINTSGNIKVYNKDDELIEDNSKNIGTGWKIKIELTDSVLEYVVSVKGDITGDGISNINDVIKIAKYLTNKDEIVGMEYTNAADITNDGKVNINDVIRLSKTLMGRN